VTILVGVGLSGGCISGSLATSTGPRVSGDWSVANEQFALAGEQVSFDYILTQPFKKHPLDPIGIADYCVLEVDRHREVAEPEYDGHFRFTQTLGNLAPGTKVNAKATAYKTFGRRDVQLLPDGGAISRQAGDERDRRVASDSVRLRIYQARIELDFPQTPDVLSHVGLRSRSQPGGFSHRWARQGALSAVVRSNRRRAERHRYHRRAIRGLRSDGATAQRVGDHRDAVAPPAAADPARRRAGDRGL
jgi:hypothetical protein